MKFFHKLEPLAATLAALVLCGCVSTPNPAAKDAVHAPSHPYPREIRYEMNPSSGEYNPVFSSAPGNLAAADLA